MVIAGAPLISPPGVDAQGLRPLDFRAAEASSPIAWQAATRTAPPDLFALHTPGDGVSAMEISRSTPPGEYSPTQWGATVGLAAGVAAGLWLADGRSGHMSPYLLTVPAGLVVGAGIGWLVELATD